MLNYQILIVAVVCLAMGFFNRAYCFLPAW